MIPFCPILCPLCDKKLYVDSTSNDKEIRLICPDKGSEDLCAHITYNVEWELKEITYFFNEHIVVCCTDQFINFDKAVIPYNKLDLLYFGPTLELVKTLMVFQ